MIYDCRPGWRTTCAGHGTRTGPVRKEVSLVVEKRYAQYVMPAPIRRLGIPGYPWNSVYGHQGELGADCTLCFHHITDRFEEGPPHKHDTHQIMCFVGSNLEDISSFDAEIEIALGYEGEVQMINRPSVVSIPPGLMHCPLRFTRLGRPVLFIEIVLAGSYQRYTASGTVQDVRPEDVTCLL